VRETEADVRLKRKIIGGIALRKVQRKTALKKSNES